MKRDETICVYLATCLTVSAVALLFSSTITQAQTTREWIGPVGGDWNTATNWDPNGVPAINDTLILGFGDSATSLSPFLLKDGGEIFMSDGAHVDFDFLTLAEDTTAAVTVSGGSTVTTVQVTIASSFFGGGSGTVLVTGAGSSLTDATQFSVGPVDGEGHVTVADNAFLSSPDFRLQEGSLTINSGATVQAGQVLSTASFGPFDLSINDATFDVASSFSFATEGTGTLDITNNGHMTSAGSYSRIATQSGANVTATVNTGGVWDIQSTGPLEVGGPIGVALLDVGAGGTVNADNGIIISTTSTLKVHGGTVNTAGLQLNGTLDFNDGVINVNGGDFNYSGVLNIDGVNAQVNLNTNATSFGTSITVGDAQSGSLTVNGASLNTNSLTIGSNTGATGTVTLDQGNADINTLNVGVMGSGALIVNDSYLETIETYIGNSTSGDGGVMTLQDNANLQTLGQVVVGTSSTSGALQILDDAQANIESGLVIASQGTLVLDDAELTVRGEFSGFAISSQGTIDFRSGRLTMVGGVNQISGGLVVPREGQFLIDGGTGMFATFDSPIQGLVGSAIDASFGNITIGDPNSYTGFQTEGTLRVFPDTDLTIGSRGFAELGRLTQLPGQFGVAPILRAPNGLALGIGDNLAGNGSIIAQFVAAAGSIIDAEGDLDIGEASAPDGFASDGRLHIHQHTVTLNDANTAVLGSLTTIGEPAMPGTLAAPNGIILEFGKNITGFGTVNTPNDPFKPFINNGDLLGTSPAEPLTLTGYVKGVGTMDNVVITGTDAPGFSPATVYRGSVTYAGTLEIEIGGTAPGEYDRLIHSDFAMLGGVLNVKLINNYTPTLGDNIGFLYADAGLSGSFNSINLPDISGLGLGWLLNPGGSALFLEVVAVTLQGDLDGDGFVGINDLNIVLGNWNQNVPPANPLADPTGDGFVGIDDLNAVLGNWNAGTLPNSTANIPEPGTLGLALLSGVMWSAGRRRQRT